MGQSVSENLVMNKKNEVGMRTRRRLTRWNKMCKRRERKREKREER